MPEFTTGTLALTDDAYDRERSDDGRSRYGAYLRLNASLLHEDGQPLTAPEFAFAAWQIATSPIMSPGYVRIRPDLHNLTPTWICEDDLALRIDVRLRHRALATWPAAQVADWQTDRWTVSSGFTALTEPEAADRPALLVTATVLLPVPTRVLITPTTARPGPVMTREAKQAVKALASWANKHAHLVNDLVAGGGR